MSLIGVEPAHAAFWTNQVRKSSLTLSQPSLAWLTRELRLAGSVGLIDDLPRAEALDLLRRRADSMDAWHSSVAAHVPRGTNLEEWGPVGEVVTLWLHTAQSRAEWTRQLIGRLERGLYRMADDH